MNPTGLPALRSGDSLDPRLLDLIEEFTQRVQAGEAIDVEGFVEAHPSHAQALREVLPALRRLGQLGGSAERDLGSGSCDFAPRELGDYQLLRQIGRGGMGIVYEAMQASLGRHVALKVLPAQATAGHARERFRREAQAAARLHHQNIVPVFGVGQDGDVHYYAMQYIDGLGLDLVLRHLRLCREGLQAEAPTGDQARSRTLAEGLLAGYFAGQPAGERAAPPGSSEAGAVNRTGPAPPEDRYFRSVAALVARVAEALHYAHGEGILHRDVKPSNLLLDTRGVIWVTDFGLARVEGLEELTGSRDLVGTLRYMAPERFRGHVDARSDVYSLGLTLYELLTWRPAFDENDQARLIEQINHGSPPAPRLLQPRLPRDLETIVLKAIDHEPARRYQTAAALAEDLQRFCNDQPIRARPLGWVGGAVKWGKRRPAVAALLGALAVALLGLVGVGVAAYLNVRSALAAKEKALEDKEAEWQRAENERAQAEKARDEAEAAAYRALLGETRALRLAHEPGWRRQALANLETLVAMKTPQRDLLRLREEGVLCLSGFDLEECARLPSPGDAVIGAIDFSPDGTMLACIDSRAGVRLWDLRTPRSVRTLLRGKRGSLWTSLVGQRRMLGFRRDGRGLLLPAGQNGWAFLPLDGGTPAVPPALTRKGLLSSMAQDAPGRVLAVGWPDGTITGHTPGSGALLWKMAALKGQPRLFTLHPDGERLVVVAADGAGLAIHHPGSRASPRVLGRHEGVLGLTISGDGRLLASASRDGSVKLWRLDEAREWRTLTGKAQDGILRLAFTPTGDLLASASSFYGVHLWETASGQLLQVLPGGSAPGTDVRFSPDGKHLAVVDRSVVLYRVRRRRHCWGFRSDVPMGTVLAIHPHEPVLAAAQMRGVFLCDLRRGQPLRTWQLPPGRGWISALSFSPGGQTLAAATATTALLGSQEYALHFSDPNTGELRRQVNCKEWHAGVLAFDSAGDRLVTAATRGLLAVDLHTGNVKPLPLPHLLPRGIYMGCGEPVAVLDKDRLVVAIEEKTSCRIVICSASDGRLLRQVRLPGPGGWVFAVAAGGRTLAAESAAGTLHLLALPTLEAIGTPQPTTPGPNGLLAFANSDRLLVSARRDQGLVLWQTPELKRLCHLPWSGSLAQLACARHGRHLALAGIDGQVTVYDLGLIRADLKRFGLDW
jgi:serine/threonine protein kinase/WD40 repeat protein